MVVVLRCVPCEECVRLDDEVVDADPRLRPLLERFVRVRLVSTNGLDLATFQFDTDQSFAVFFLRAGGPDAPPVVYGRYGTRSHRTDWKDDVSVEGLAAALRGALALHEAWPAPRESLAAKRGPQPAHATPERWPTLRERYGPRLAKEGPVVPSCIHCHQIGDAERAERLAAGGLPDELLFPFPHPKAIGLVLDPAHPAKVRAVAPGSAAEVAGLRVGDEVRSMAGQPLLSIADVQWVLHAVPASGGNVAARVHRDGVPVEAVLTLADGWRRADDIAWRASTWQLRRAALGGMKLDPSPDGAGLLVAHVGQYAPHDRARRAGVRRGDVLVSYDGVEGLVREADVLRLGLDPARRARPVPLVLRRGEETLRLSLPAE
jgi:hypothetical protein